VSDKPKVLFVDDEPSVREANAQTLDLAGFEVRTFARAEDLLADLPPDWSGVVISDIRMPGMDGLHLLRRLQADDPDLPVVLVTGHGDVAMAVQAMREGAYDFIEKPFSVERLVDTARRAVGRRVLSLENRQLRRELEMQSAPGPRIVGNAPAIKRLRDTIARIADIDADVLILGETGTGKELVARSLHEHSVRREHNFVPVNCGAIPENLIEAELFGHESGAFTGAKGQRIGRFEHAHKGTLFLDEIESMPLPVQVHLLRVLQERSIERLGSNKAIPLDLRVVAATKLDLKGLGEQGSFREDLYYRLNVVALEVPPLRERLEDIPLLFQHFMLVAGARYGLEAPVPGPDQIRALLCYRWPGNVRELRNVADRYVLLGDQLAYDIERMLNGGGQEPALTLPQQVECFEKSVVVQQLAIHKGSIKDTMASLGVPRKTLYDKMKKYGLDKNQYKDG
jgi:two-component system C4-dicarboxylate transport response regulator DctD